MPVFQSVAPFILEGSTTLDGIQLKYEVYGTLNPKKDNVIWVAHAFTGNSAVKDWWPDMVGPGKTLDTNNYCVICANMLGSCYGSTGPEQINPKTGKPYGPDFPMLTNRDIVKAFDLLRLNLGIEAIQLAIGGSMGGQQLLEWTLLRPDLMQKICLLATNAVHSPWGIAFNEAQRMALEADNTFFSSKPGAGGRGMEAARAIAMLSYRNYQMYERTQSDNNTGKIENFKASSYQRYQGEKLKKRFNPWSYKVLSKAMDSHNVGRDRGGLIAALKKIKAEVLIFGVESDLLFPIDEQVFLAKFIPKAQFEPIDSPYGHDGFLVETKRISKLLLNWMHKSYSQSFRPNFLGSHSKVPKVFSALPGTESF